MKGKVKMTGLCYLGGTHILFWKNFRNEKSEPILLAFIDFFG